MSLVAQNYYRHVNTNKLTDRGLETAIASLDPYSHYYPPAQYKVFQQETNPQVTGIGVQVSSQLIHGGMEVEEVFRGSPAAKVGLTHGDIIVAVNGTSLKRQEPSTQSSKLIKGTAGTGSC